MMAGSFLTSCHPVIILLHFTSMVPTFQANTHQNSCTSSRTTLTCDHDIPAEIPEGITDVIVKDYIRSNITQRKQVFDNRSWQQITKLDIRVISRRQSFCIHNYDFFPLKNLKSLRIDAQYLQFVEPYGFAGLSNLSSITFASASNLRSDEFASALTSLKSPKNIESLGLNEMCSQNGKPFIWNKTFMEMLMTKSIKRLKLSNTFIIIQDYAVIGSIYPLQSLDVSNSTIIGTLSLSSKTAKKSNLIPSSLQNVKSLNLSGIHMRLFPTRDYDIRNTAISNARVLDLLQVLNLESLDISNINTGKLSFNNVLADISDYKISLKNIYCRNNRLEVLNVACHWPSSVEVLKIDLSSNGMRYLSPKFLAEVTTLETLLLANNVLFTMEHYPEFEDILTTFTQLAHLDMAYNRLGRIPYNMFLNNKELKTLKLNGNHLETIKFKTKHLQMLDNLDLRDNKIKYVDGHTLAELQPLVQLQINVSKSFPINFHGNHIECSCKSLDFIIWLASPIFKFAQHETYSCNIEGNIIPIDQEAIVESRYLCKRAAIKAAISATAFIALAVTIVLAYITLQRIRKRKQKNDIRIFLDDFENQRLDEKYLLFLSYCSVDSEMIIRTIHNHLDKTLKEMVGFENNIICHGDVHFKPGFSIICEIMRCISDSAIVIFVVSRAFCASDWCRMEVKEAYEQDKPIILIFIENVDENLMPSYLQTIFHRNTRVNYKPDINGEHRLVPSWQSVCESVIILARTNHEQQKEDQLRLGLQGQTCIED